MLSFKKPVLKSLPARHRVVETLAVFVLFAVSFDAFAGESIEGLYNHAVAEFKAGNQKAGVALLLKSRNTNRFSSAEKKWLRSKAYQLATAFRTQETQQIYQEGLEAFNSGQMQKAANRFRAAAELDSAQLLVLVRLGQSLVLTKEYSEALREFSRALEVYPNNDDVLKWVGKAYLEKGDTEQATKIFSQIIRNNKIKSQSLMIWNADAIHRQGSEAQAIAFLKLSVESNPYYLDAALRLAKYQLDHKGLRTANDVLTVRKNLQVALSRVDFVKAKSISTESDELDLFLYDLENTRVQLNNLIEIADFRLAEISRKQQLQADVDAAKKPRGKIE